MYLLKAFVLLAFLSVYMSVAVAAEKCVCPQKRTVEAEYDSSQMVFIGQVAEVKPKFPLHKDHMYVKLRVMKKFKGFENTPKKEVLVMFTPVNSDPCSVKFVKDNDYLIFAKGNPAFLKTTLCDLSGMQEERAKELIELEKIKAKR
jgi:hypothetical protein